MLQCNSWIGFPFHGNQSVFDKNEKMFYREPGVC